MTRTTVDGRIETRHALVLWQQVTISAASTKVLSMHARDAAVDLAGAHGLGTAGFTEPDPGGRPRLADPRLDVGISHSSDTLFVAVARGARIGVDLENAPDAVLGRRALQRRISSPAEYAQLVALSDARAARAARRLWVAKESVAKAIGAGLRQDLRGIIVPGVWSTELDGECRAAIAVQKPSGTDVFFLTTAPGGYGTSPALPVVFEAA